jgi:hypothetical protein
MEDVAVRQALPEDWPWPSVAGLLVELGRGVAKGTAEDPPTACSSPVTSAVWTR